DTASGPVTVVAPPTFACCLTIPSTNSATGTFGIETNHASDLLTQTGVTVTAPVVVLYSQVGSIGSAAAFSTAAGTLTAHAANSVNVADSNGATGTTLASTSNVFGSYGNAASSSYTVTEAGSGGIQLENNVCATGSGGKVSLSASAGSILNAAGYTPTIYSGTSGSSGSVALSANGAIGACVPGGVINIATPAVTANASNGSVVLSDKIAVVVTGSNTAAASASCAFSLVDTASAGASPADTISFAPGASISNALNVVLNASGTNGQVDLTHGSISNASTVEIATNASMPNTLSLSNISGATTIVLWAVTGDIGTPTTPVQFSSAKLSATAS